MMTLLLLAVVVALLLFLGYKMLPVRQLHWSGLDAGWQQVRLAELSFQVGQNEQWWDIQLHQLEVGWNGWPPPLVRAQQLRLIPMLTVPVSATATAPLPDDTSFSVTDVPLPAWPQVTIPNWLAHSIDVRQLSLQLPCQTTSRQICELTGSLLLTSSEQNSHSLDLQLQGDGQQLLVQLDLLTKAQQLEQLRIRQLAVALDIKALASAGWLQGLPAGLAPETIHLHLSGSWQAQQLQLQLLQPLLADFSYQTVSLHLPAAQLQLRSGQLQCNEPRWQQCQLQLDATASVRQLRHALWQTSDWHWQGQVQGQLDGLKLKGELQSQPALKIAYQAALSSSVLKLDWQLTELFLLASNPFKNMALWPELLDLQRGKVAASGQLQLQLPGGQLSQVQAKADLTELYGIYDRTAFGGLTAQLVLKGDQRSFTLQLPQLNLKQLDHGFQAGPAQLSGQYRADWTLPAEGDIRLSQAQINIFGGKLALAETQFNVQQPTIEFKLAVQQIQLAELLKQHPLGQVQGDGVISGTIPLRLQQYKMAKQTASALHTGANQSTATQSVTSPAMAQWQVLGGELQAESPGGRLQYQYQPVAGQTAGGMDLAWEALSDFHYQTLASTVELQPDGKVLLHIRLHGYNPKMQQGRPVNFNINIEEDLPTLLTSLQLSGQISDLVRRRIQQKILQKQSAKPSTVKPR